MSKKPPREQLPLWGDPEPPAAEPPAVVIPAPATRVFWPPPNGQPYLWHDLDPYWDAIHEAGRRRDAQGRAYWKRHTWNPDSSALGYLGEQVYGMHWGIGDADLTDYGPNYDDGGRDFPGVDVDAKAVFYVNHPLLMRPADKPLRAGWFVLVAVDMPRRRGRLVGEATRAELGAAPLIDYGKGAGPTHVLEAACLHPVQPPAAHPWDGRR